MITSVVQIDGRQFVLIPNEFHLKFDQVDIQWGDQVGGLVIRDDPGSRMDDFFAWLATQPPGTPVDNPPMTPEVRLDVAAYMDMDD